MMAEIIIIGSRLMVTQTIKSDIIIISADDINVQFANNLTSDTELKIEGVTDDYCYLLDEINRSAYWFNPAILTEGITEGFINHVKWRKFCPT